jgi:hypothetical protein
MMRWVKAGEMLVELRKQDPEVFLKIRFRAKWLSVDALWMLLKIGEHKCRPEIFAVTGRLGERLSTMTYEEQSAFLDKPTHPFVLKIAKGKPVTRPIAPGDVLGCHMDQLFAKNQIRTEREQVEYLNRQGMGKGRAGSEHCVPGRTLACYRVEWTEGEAPALALIIGQTPNDAQRVKLYGGKAVVEFYADKRQAELPPPTAKEREGAKFKAEEKIAVPREP